MLMVNCYCAAVVHVYLWSTTAVKVGRVQQGEGCNFEPGETEVHTKMDAGVRARRSKAFMHEQKPNDLSTYSPWAGKSKAQISVVAFFTKLVRGGRERRLDAPGDNAVSASSHTVCSGVDGPLRNSQADGGQPGRVMETGVLGPDQLYQLFVLRLLEGVSSTQFVFPALRFPPTFSELVSRRRYQVHGDLPSVFLRPGFSCVLLTLRHVSDSYTVLLRTSAASTCIFFALALSL